MTTGLEDRLRADLPRLADHVIRTSDPADVPAANASPGGGAGDGADDRGPAVLDWARSTRRPSRAAGGWRAAAAAALVLVVVGFAIVVTRDGDGGVRAGDELATTVPAPDATDPDVAPAPAFVPMGDPLVVSIDLYSGLPNPVFAPTPEEQARLVELLGDLESPDGRTFPPPVLGFRGFAIDGLAPAGAEAGGRYRIEVWKGLVKVSGYDVTTFQDRGTITRSDPSGALSELLLDLTEAHLAELDPKDGRFTPEFIQGLRVEVRLQGGPDEPSDTTPGTSVQSGP